MKSTTLAALFTLVLPAFASPAPAPAPVLVDKRTPTTVVATATTLFSIPTSAIPANCTTINPTGATYNDIDNGICRALTLIFARGTTEEGNIGDIVGPPFVAALQSMIGSSRLAVQGVNNYPADVAGFLAGGSKTGSLDMAAQIARTMVQCPFTKLCVSGYSQGAQVAHNAANIITQGQTDFINSVVLYGDPDDGEAFGRVPARKVSTDCHVGDDICLHGDTILPPHLDYCLDVNQEAAFVIQRSGLKY